MLPTPTTSHLTFNRIYEPAEDSYLLLDTLSSPSETTFLQTTFPSSSPPPFVLEIGTGSGVVLSFLHANAKILFGRDDILTAGVDINPFACRATRETIAVAEKECASNEVENDTRHGFYLGNILGDLSTPIRGGQIDVLVFNPPYVPTPSLPAPANTETIEHHPEVTTFEEDSYFLELSYAGGRDGMEITDRLLEMIPGGLSGRGVAYVLLCAQNRPEEVMKRVLGWEGGWRAEIVGRSGKKGGWEKLVVVRVWRGEVV